MPIAPRRSAFFALLAASTLPVSAGLSAQDQGYPVGSNITVTGEALPDTTAMTEGPEIKGIISARSGDKMRVTAADGTSTVIFIDDNTKIKASSGLFGSKSTREATSLLNGIPVEVKTMQAGSVLLASQVVFKKKDLKTANMIRTGTEQGFAEQTAATQALRGRMGDIDKYNIKNTTNVNFDTGKAVLSAQAKNELCSTAAAAEQTENALLLVVGYSDSTGPDEFNQTLSEKRASSVINHLQQACRWKPYRMLTPTGMAEADPLADNETPEGKAQNRRVAVNILVSKSVDGL